MARSPTSDTPASSLRSSSNLLGLVTRPMVSNTAQVFIAVSFLSQLLVAYAGAMELAARQEYRRLVERAQINSEIYGFSLPVTAA